MSHWDVACLLDRHIPACAVPAKTSGDACPRAGRPGAPQQHKLVDIGIVIFSGFWFVLIVKRAYHP